MPVTAAPISKDALPMNAPTMPPPNTPTTKSLPVSMAEFFTSCSVSRSLVISPSKPFFLAAFSYEFFFSIFCVVFVYCFLKIVARFLKQGDTLFLALAFFTFQPCERIPASFFLFLLLMCDVFIPSECRSRYSCYYRRRLEPFFVLLPKALFLVGIPRSVR